MSARSKKKSLKALMLVLLSVCCVVFGSACAGQSEAPARVQSIATGLAGPCAVGMDQRGNLYVAEALNGRVSLVGEDGHIIPVVEGLDGICGMAVLKDGSMYLSIPHRGEIVWVSVTGQLKVVATGLDSPGSMSLDHYGRLMVVERGAGRLLRMNSSGGFEELAKGKGLYCAVDSDMGLAVASADGLTFRTALGKRFLPLDGKSESCMATSPNGFIYVSNVNDSGICRVMDGYRYCLSLARKFDVTAMVGDRDGGVVVATAEGELLRIGK